VLPPTPLDRLAELFAKVETFFQRARAQHGDAIACKSGCDDCCRRAFSVTTIEAAIIRDALASMPPRSHERERDACPALDPDGRWAIYEARPLICRTHGLPIRFPPRDEDPRRLPLVDACPKNFVGQDLNAIDATSILDQQTLSTILAALDAAYADERGIARGQRIEMNELFGEP